MCYYFIIFPLPSPVSLGIKKGGGKKKAQRVGISISVGRAFNILKKGKSTDHLLETSNFNGCELWRAHDCMLQGIWQGAELHIRILNVFGFALLICVFKNI